MLAKTKAGLRPDLNKIDGPLGAMPQPLVDLIVSPSPVYGYIHSFSC